MTVPDDSGCLSGPGLQHRLATVPASTYLSNTLDDANGQHISSGLDALDHALGGGVARGAVTEVWGPPGVGKTGFCLQLAGKVLRHRGSVLWVDTGSILAQPRIDRLIDSNPQGHKSLGRLVRWKVASLAHLFALIHSLPAVLPADAGLLVVDEISLAFMAAFPRTADGSMASGQGGGKRTNAQARWTLARKQTVMANLTHRLGRLAAMHNLAVVVVNQSMTRVRRDLGYAVLEPTIASPTWNEGIESQILLFRDAYKHASQPIRSIRLASVVTRTNDWQYEQGHWNGISPLVISEDGIHPLELAVIGESVQSNMMLPSDKSENTRKRGHEAIRDSDEEATEPYVELNGLGWDEEEWELEGEQSEPEETLPLSTEQTKESAAAVSG